MLPGPAVEQEPCPRRLAVIVRQLAVIGTPPVLSTSLRRSFYSELFPVVGAFQPKSFAL
jgi:hypothetical protein